MSRTVRLLGVLLLSTLAISLGPTSPATASSYVPLNGDGSSFAGPAISQWSRDVVSQGITINFNPNGSQLGRADYLQNASDFAATDIQYLTKDAPDPFNGGFETPDPVAYSYIPIVAGGTSFLYNLTVAGHRITDMRLSGLTIAKIFTGAIKNWNDPAIAHDYGRALPSQQITVVTRSDGSGATYQFTRYLAKMFPTIWQPFCKSRGGPDNCGPTELYPGFPGSQQRAGSDQVAGYISASFGQGTIGYDEYAYAKESNIPVVRVENKAGYFALPTASNVAIALQAAIINDKDPTSVTYLIQNLDNVYTNPDPRTYPVSSYSYLVVPRISRVNPEGQTVGPPPRWTGPDGLAKGKTLSTWLNYVLCGAQQSAGQLGYSPLPVNLVIGGFKQDKLIPGAVAQPDQNKLSDCNNPTYHNGVNYLTKYAPYPTKCDKAGSPLTCVVSGSSYNNPNAASSNGGRTTTTTTTTTGGGNGTRTTGGTKNGGSTKSGGSTNAGGSSNTGGNTTPGGSITPGGVTSGVTKTGSGAAKTVIDPVTGVVVKQGGTAATDGGSSAVLAEPVSVNGSAGEQGIYGVLAALEILAAVLVPGTLGIWLSRRRRP